MDGATLTALLGFLGTIVGSVGGILASSRLTSFRLQQLEEKVKLHNGLVERMTAAEEKIKSNSHRLTDLERTYRNIRNTTITRIMSRQSRSSRRRRMRHTTAP